MNELLEERVRLTITVRLRFVNDGRSYKSHALLMIKHTEETDH